MRMSKVLFLGAVLSTVSCGDAADDGEKGSECNGAKCDNAGEDPADGPARTCAELVDNKSGKPVSTEDIMANTDPVAEIVLSGGDERCPMSVADIVEQLKAKGCTGHGSQLVSERSQLLGVFTDYRSVTELTCSDKRVFLHFPILAENVKEIVEGPDGPTLGKDIDRERLLANLDHTFPAIIAENTDGIFNYYQSRSTIEHVCTPRGAALNDDGILVADAPEDARSCSKTEDCEGSEQCLPVPGDEGVVADFRFFGNSMDFVNLPDREKTLQDMANALPTAGATEADIEHSLDIDRNCAVCHPGGGLTMRELKTPWIHWDFGAAHFTSPQGNELISAGSDVLGSAKNGLNFQGTVERSNADFNGARIKLAVELIESESEGSRTFTTGNLLRPLFCTDEFNIDTTGGSPGNDFRRMEFRDVVLDTTISGSDSLPAKHEDFLAEIERPDRDWKLAGFNASKLAGLRQLLGIPEPRETLGTMTFVTRADIDINYQKQLVDANIIDPEFVQDVLMVDFTRATFSEERCGLMEIVDKVDAGDFLERGTVAIKEEFEQAGSLKKHEADFLANLEEDGTNAKAAAAAFFSKCEELSNDASREGEMLDNYLRYVAQVRKRAGHEETAMGLGEASFMMFRFPGANGFMMADAFGQPFEHGLRFDPETCELITNYPGAEPEVEEPEDPPAEAGQCSERGCDFAQGADCQCDTQCEEFDDCCSDGPSNACEAG